MPARSASASTRPRSSRCADAITSSMHARTSSLLIPRRRAILLSERPSRKSSKILCVRASISVIVAPLTGPPNRSRQRAETAGDPPLTPVGSSGGSIVPDRHFLEGKEIAKPSPTPLPNARPTSTSVWRTPHRRGPPPARVQGCADQEVPPARPLRQLLPRRVVPHAPPCGNGCVAHSLVHRPEPIEQGSVRPRNRAQDHVDDLSRVHVVEAHAPPGASASSSRSARSFIPSP